MTVLRLVPRQMGRVEEMLARLKAPKPRFIGGRGFTARVLAFKHTRKL